MFHINQLVLMTTLRIFQCGRLERNKVEKTESRMKVHRETNGLTGHFCAHHVCVGPPHGHDPHTHPPTSWSLSRQRVQSHRVGRPGGEKKTGHVLTRGQSQSAPRGQSLSQPCKFMTAWQLLLWNEACALWCVTPVRQVKRWNPVHFIGNSTPRLKRQKSSMRSVFRCLAHWSLCSPLNGRSTILKWVA